MYPASVKRADLYLVKDSAEVKKSDETYFKIATWGSYLHYCLGMGARTHWEVIRPTLRIIRATPPPFSASLHMRHRFLNSRLLGAAMASPSRGRRSPRYWLLA